MKSEQTIKIFTDGAVRGNNLHRSNIGSWAFVIPNKNETIQKSKVVLDTSNNRMELEAIKQSLSWLSNEKTPDSETVYSIYTDSDISYKTFRGITNKDGIIDHGSSWYGGWKKRGIKTDTLLKANNKPPMNLDRIEEIYRLLVLNLKADKSVTFNFIAAHTGKTDEYSLGNHQADSLCNKTIDSYIELTKDLLD